MAGAARDISTGRTEGVQAPPNAAARASRPQFGLADLEDCLEKGRFQVEYQPKVALQANATSQFGVEALCRIRHERYGAVPPDLFIALAEKHGLIARLTDGVVRRAFTAWADWCKAGLRLRLALNVSPLLLNSGEWCGAFLDACAEFSADPKWITLEITETAAGATDENAREILHLLHKKGFSLSIDDFGTGFSSLATLYRLPIAEMKIDKSFIFDLEAKAGARELVESAVAMAKRLGIKVVAEGVESEAVFRELRRIGCDEAQGFFIGRSMVAEAVVPFFTGWSQAHQPVGQQPGGQALPKIVAAQALLNEVAGDLTACAAPVAHSYAKFAAPRDVQARPREIVAKILPLMLGGKNVPALALCHEALRELTATAGSRPVVEKLLRVQGQLEQELLRTTDLELKGSYETVRLLPRDSVTLGQPSRVAHVDIEVHSRWLGPGDRNLRIFREGGDYFLEDLGGINGYLMNGERLKTREPVEIPYGRSLVEARLLSGTIAPLSILLHRKSSDPDAVAVRLDCDTEILRADLNEREWLELKAQLGVTWIVFSGGIQIGKSSDCAVMLSDCSAAQAGTVSFDDGFRIAPAPGQSVEIENVRFGQAVPLMAPATLRLAGSLVETTPCGKGR